MSTSAPTASVRAMLSIRSSSVAASRQPLGVGRLCLRSIATGAKPARAHVRPSLEVAARPQRHTQDVFLRQTASGQSRSLSSTPRRQKAILNPRMDEDGKDMDIEITPRAANRLAQIMSTDANPDLLLRVTVESGGCHGFQYLMALTDMGRVSRDEDTVFEGARGARIVLDEPSLDLLKGSKVDYTMELIGSQFKIVDNPLATSSCGCGTSFDIKA